jgi:serine/threonine protein kinase
MWDQLRGNKAALLFAVGTTQLFGLEMLSLRSIKHIRTFNEETSTLVYELRIQGEPSHFVAKKTRNHQRSPATSLREVRMLFSLQHPHIATMLGILMDEHETLLLYTPVAGYTLQHVFETQSLDHFLQPELIGSLDSTVRFIHSHDIIQGDLPPRNILIKPVSELETANFDCPVRFSWYLTGFGASEQVCEPGNVEYSKEHAAPEVISEGNFSLASDGSSLGHLLSEMSLRISSPRPSSENQDQLKGAMCVFSSKRCLKNNSWT